MSNFVKETTDSTFKTDVLEADTPVLVDFWAPWCQPCRMIQPHLDAFAEEHANSSAVQVFKMNVDGNSQTPAEYAIRGIPAVLLFHKGELVATEVGGNMNKTTFQAMLDRVSS